MKKNTQRRLTLVARTCASLARAARVLEAAPYKRSPMNPFSPEERAKLQEEIKKQDSKNPGKPFRGNPKLLNTRPQVSKKEKMVAGIENTLRKTKEHSRVYIIAVYDLLSKMGYFKYPGVKDAAEKAAGDAISFLGKRIGPDGNIVRISRGADHDAGLKLLSDLLGNAYDLDDFGYDEKSILKNSEAAISGLSSPTRAEQNIDWHNPIQLINTSAHSLAVKAKEGPRKKRNPDVGLIRKTIASLGGTGTSGAADPEVVSPKKKKRKKFMGLF